MSLCGRSRKNVKTCHRSLCASFRAIPFQHVNQFSPSVDIRHLYVACQRFEGYEEKYLMLLGDAAADQFFDEHTGSTVQALPEQEQMHNYCGSTVYS